MLSNHVTHYNNTITIKRTYEVQICAYYLCYDRSSHFEEQRKIELFS